MTILNFQYIKDHPYETIKYLDGIQLLKVDARSLDYFYNQIWFFAGALRTYIELTSDLRDEADQLINFIESSYDIAES